MARHSERNPLALLVLAVLWAQPTHPYQIVQTLRQRHKDRSVKLTYGSLYTVVAALERDGLIESIGVTREGNLPPRTTYQVTDAGTRELVDWLDDGLAHPQPEYPAYMTALVLLPALAPERVAMLLDERGTALDDELIALESEMVDPPVPELFNIELTYLQALLHAERDFTAQLASRIRAGDIEGHEVWQALQQSLVDGRPDPVAVPKIIAGAGPAPGFAAHHAQDGTAESSETTDSSHARRASVDARRASADG
jgi:DNA-binding PadR family transcriptional regulator